MSGPTDTDKQRLHGDDFEKAFAEFRQARRAGMGGRPRKDHRDPFIKRRVDEVRHEIAKLQRKDRDSQTGARRHRKGTNAAKKAEAAKWLLDALTGTRQRARKAGRSAPAIVAEELNRLRAAEIKYLTECMSAADDEGKADVMTMIRKIEAEKKDTPGAVKAALRRYLERLSEAEKRRPAEIKLRLTKARRLLVIRAGVEAW